MSSRAVVPQSFGRLTFLLLWSLVSWGVLLIGSAVTDAFTEGSIAFARLLPTRDANSWEWLGALCVLLALGAGLLGSAFLVTKIGRASDE